MRKLVAATAAGLLIFAAQAVAADTVQADSVRLGDRIGAADGQGSQAMDSTGLLFVGAAAVAIVVFVAATHEKTTSP